MLARIGQAIGAIQRADGRLLVAGPRFATAVGWLSASGALIAQGQVGSAWLVLPAMIGLGLGALARNRLFAVFLALVPVAFWGYASWRSDGAGVNDISSVRPARSCIFRAEIVSLAKSSSDSLSRALVSPYQVLFPTRRRVTGLTMLTVRGSAPNLTVGDHIEVTAHLLAPAEKRYPWEFDSRGYFRRCGVNCLAVANGSEVKLLLAGQDSAPDVAGKGQDFIRWLEKTLDSTRSRLIAFHRLNVGAIEGDLLSAMVLGDRAVSLPADVKDRFRDAGLSHMLAASGFNLTIVVAMTWWVGRLIVRAPVAINGLCFLSMLLFVCLAGPSPSVMRAALMCSLVLVGRCSFRSSSVTCALAVALLVTLLLDPGSIVDVGLQLSYVATFGIVCGAQALVDWMTPVRPAALLRWFVEAVAVVLVAQFSILPLQLSYFFQVGMLFLPANLLVALAVPVATALGFVSSALVLNESTAALVAPLAALLDGIASYPVRWIILVVDCIAQLEFSKLTIGPPPLAASIFYCAAFLVFLLCLRTKTSRTASLCLLSIAFAALLWRSPLPPLTVAAFPGSIVIIDANRQAICLGDCSGKTVARFLAYNGVRPNAAGGGNFKVRVSGAWTTVESASPPASILVGSPATQWQSPNTIPPRMAALIILRTRDPSTKRSAGTKLYRAACDLARDNCVRWLVFDGGARRLGHAVATTVRDSRTAPLPRVRFLGGQVLVLTSSVSEPAVLRPYVP